MFTNHDDPAPKAAKPASRSYLLSTLLLILAFVMLVASLYISSRLRTGSGENHRAVGTRLPELQLEPLTGDGPGVELADLKGKITLVNFWGTWCGPCRMEFPSLVTLRRKMQTESDFRLVSVSCGQGAGEIREELAEQTEDFLRTAKADIPTYFDPGEVSRQSLIEAARLRKFGYPATVLLDREGVIQALWIGYDPSFEQEMEEAVRSALARK